MAHDNSGVAGLSAVAVVDERFAHKRELGKIFKAWNSAKVHSDTKLQIDAVARSHG